MGILKTLLLVAMPALIAGYVAWLLIPCRPERSILVPSETKLLEFSPTGRYVVTFQCVERRLTLWRVDNGEAAFSAEVPCVIQVAEATPWVRWFYGFSSDDRWLAINVGSPDKDSHLIIVDLDSNNALTPISGLPPNRDRFIPQPAFSSDGCYLAYFIQTPEGINYGVLYDMAGQHEHLRLPGAFTSLGPPIREGKWFVAKEKRIECWDVAQKRRDDGFPPWPNDHPVIWPSLSPDGQAINILCFAEGGRLPTYRIYLNRFDLNSRTIETAWEYTLPPSVHLFWNRPFSQPDEFLLIDTFDDQGNLVQDLLEVSSGDVLARFSHPIIRLEDFSYSQVGQTLLNGMDDGRIYTLGRPGQIAIDSERRVLVSKQVNRDPILWRHFGNQLRWLGVRRGAPRLYLQFHSAQTGQLLDRVSLQTPYNPYDPVLAVHPSQPFLAVNDGRPNGSRLQIWRLPPPKPWGWIIFCSLAAGVCTTFLRFGIRSLIRRRRPPVGAR
jgi:hypothetical protein